MDSEQRGQQVSSVKDASPVAVRKVGVCSVILLGLSGQQVVPSALIGASYMPLESGGGAWLSMLLAMCATLCVMSAVNVFARRYVVSGSLISYVGLAFGRRCQRLVAASYLIGFLAVCAAVTASTVMFIVSFLQSVGVTGAGEGWFQALAAIMIAVLGGACAWRGLDASISLTSWLAFFPLPLVVVATISAAVASGIDLRSQLAFADADWQGIVRGAIVGLAYFVGVDALAALAGETEDPKSNVPTILNSVILISGGVYVAMLLLATTLMRAHAAELEAGVSPTAIITRVGDMGLLQKPIDLLLVCATFASLVAFLNFGSRVFATAARDKFIPEIFSSIHPHFGSPTAATVLMAAAGAAIPVASQLLASSPPLQSTAYLSTLYSLFWVGPYVILCIGAIREIRKDEVKSPTQMILIIIGLSAFVLMLAESFFWPSARGVMAWLPYVMVLLTIAGYVLFLINERVPSVIAHAPMLEPRTRSPNQ